MQPMLVQAISDHSFSAIGARDEERLVAIIQRGLESAPPQPGPMDISTPARSHLAQGEVQPPPQGGEELGSVSA